MNIVTDKDFIQKKAVENEHQHIDFRTFLKTLPSQQLDEMVHQLNNSIEPQINCTACGACCKHLMINVTAIEAQAVAQHLQISDADFKETYLEESLQGQLIMNTIPCKFLKDSKCTVYENRFDGCRAFPHLHEPHFQSRLFSTLIHYGKCPIIYNVVEALKIETGFTAS